MDHKYVSVYTATVLTFGFAFVGTFLMLLLGTTFSRSQRSKHKILRWFDGKQLYLFGGITACWLLSYGSYIWKEIATVRMSFETKSGDLGTIGSSATIIAFDKELKIRASNQAAKARAYFLAGEHDLDAGDFKSATVNFEKSQQALPTMSAYLNVGGLKQYFGRLSDSEQALVAGLQLARKDDNKRFEEKFLENLGLLYRFQGKPTEARAAFNSALSIVGDLRDELGEASVTHKLGVIDNDEGNRKAALEEFDRALKVFQKAKDPREGNVLADLGNVYEDLGETDRALQNYTLAGEIFSHFGERYLSEALLNNVGVLQSDQGDIAAALQSLKQAEDLAVQLGDKIGEANAINNMASVHDAEGNLPAGLKSAQKALAIYTEIGNSPGRASALINLGILYRELGDYKKSLASSDEALKLCVNQRNQAGQIEALNNEAATYMQMRDLKRAYQQAEAAVRLSQSSDDPLVRGTASQTLGEVEAKQKNWGRALSLVGQARKDYESAHAQLEIADALGRMGIIHADKGDIAQALDFLKQACSIYESKKSNSFEYREYKTRLSNLEAIH